MSLSVEQIAGKVRRLEQKAASRDARMADVLSVRRGEADAVVPGMFPSDWPKPIIANFVDVAARDLAELIAPMPSVNCSVVNMVGEASKKFAAKKTKIAQWYAQSSELDRQLFTGADQYVTYGFLPFYVEPNFDSSSPRIVIEDPVGAYPEFDRWGRCTSYSKKWLRTVDDLCNEFPEYDHEIRQGEHGIEQEGSALLELWRYCDADQITLFLPERKDLVLVTAPNKLGRTPAYIAVRPSFDNEMHGQFDDVLWVQLARARMALLGLEAAEKSVQAPIALPSDVQEMAFGPDAVLRSSSPEKIRRVGVELPSGAFAESQLLDAEMRTGARYPDVRSGNQSASVITGRGIQELMGGFDTQVKTAQTVLGHALKMVLQLCFELDENLWPDKSKTIQGVSSGAPFKDTYRPSKDIAGDYTVQVDYGFAAGMDPNRAVVFLLQLRGDKLIDRDTVQRQLPWDVDVVKLQERIDAEELSDALKQGVFAYVQELGAMAQAGVDPSIALRQVATLIEKRQNGEELHKAALTAFAPPPQPPAGSGAPDDGGATPPPGSSPAGTTPGLPEGVAPGQAGMAPGGRPDLQTLLAALGSNGKPQLSAGVSRRIPV
jgi:hypothetical protein